MADRTITWNIRANLSGAVNQMKTLGKATQDAADSGLEWAEKNEQAIGTLTRGFGAAGIAATAFAGLAVKKFADFDQAMSNVASTGEDARGSIDSLRQAAIDAGADTAFSATEAAGAIEELAKAGLSADQILGGGLAGSLDLAAAGSLDVASAAGYTVTALTQFGLKGSDAAHVADLLAAGAGKAMGDVEDFGSALNQTGLVASQTGLSIEETTGTLAAFAQAGLLGSDAGTSFKTMLQRLSAPSGEAARLMEELGINAYDASGQFVGMEQFAGQLTDALGDMTPAQRNAALATIFGADAVRAAAVVYSEGESGIRDWIAAVDDQGYAAETAQTKLDNLKGDLEALGGSLETALIGMGEGANGPLRSLVQGADRVVDAFGNLPPAVQQGTLALIGGGGLVALGIAGLGKMTTSIAETRTAFRQLGISAKTAGIAAGALGGALGVAAIGLTVWAQNAAEAEARTETLKATLDEFGNTTTSTWAAVNEALSSDLTTGFDKFLGRDPVSAIDLAERMGLTVQDLTDYISGQADAIDKVNAASTDYLDTGSWLEIDDRTGDVNRLKAALDDQSAALSNGQKETLQNAEADRELGLAQGDLASAYDSTTGAIDGQVGALEELVAAQQEAAGITLSEREARRQLEQAVLDATAAVSAATEAGVAQKDMLDLTTAAGIANEAALDDIASSTWDVIAAMQRNGADQKSLQGVMQTSRDRFLGVASSMGLSAEQASDLADEFGLIPDYVSTQVAVTGIDSALSAAQLLDRTLNTIDGRVVTATVATKQYGQGAFAEGGHTGSGEGHGPIGRVTVTTFDTAHPVHDDLDDELDDELAAIVAFLEASR